MEHNKEDFKVDVTYNRVYDMYFRTLANTITNLFTYHNLPSNLPAYEIEQRLLMQGNTVVFKDKVYGVVTSWCSLYGVSIYNRPTDFTAAQAVLGTVDGKLGKNGDVIYNTHYDINGGSVVRDRLTLYADLLAHTDISTRVLTINSRAIMGVTTKTDLAKRALDKYYSNLTRGELTTPLCDTGIFDSTEPLNKTNNIKLDINDYRELKDKILKEFYADFGINKMEVKRERMLSNEMLADVDYLNVNVADMLTERQQGIERINRLFDTNISVTYNRNVGIFEIKRGNNDVS